MRHRTTDRNAERGSPFPVPHSPFANQATSPARRSVTPRSAFTLVELLVVIAIIGILAALLLAAVGPALDAGKRARINATINSISDALENYKNNVGSYPPNAQCDGLANNPHLDNAAVLANFKRHFKKAFPNHREPAALINGLAGFQPDGQPLAADDNGGPGLEGGMNAAEALVFWLGGFSDDPKYPISGPGGPSYSLLNVATAQQHEADPIESRDWALDVDFTLLGPRNDAKFFDDAYSRFVTYTDPRDGTTLRRINFWYLVGPGTTSAYVYFDASRGTGVSALTDPPARTHALGGTDFYNGDTAMTSLGRVHAIKTLGTDSTATLPFRFANDGKFQILHTGTDNAWGIYPMVTPASTPPTTDRTNAAFSDWLVNSLNYHDSGALNRQFVSFADGPWTEDLSDTLTNFTDSTLEDAQP